uniref:Putative secreted protein n=1 Tax=Anopheles darlingi TaxID=43151 RepID=A0A2M4D738_ANODA
MGKWSVLVPASSHASTVLGSPVIRWTTGGYGSTRALPRCSSERVSSGRKFRMRSTTTSTGRWGRTCRWHSSRRCWRRYRHR